MKALAIWAAAVAVVLGTFAVLTASTRGTEQVFVVVDSSFPMREVWSRVPRELDRIDDRDRAEFALATEKGAVHGYRSELALGSVEPFAPCDFSSIEAYEGVADADERILITTEASCATSGLDGWTIVTVTP